MMENDQQGGRTIQAVHGLSKIDLDAPFEKELSTHLKTTNTRDGLLALYGRFAQGLSEFDIMMRRSIWRALCRSFGDSVKINEGVGFKHIETFEIGSAVFIGLLNSFESAHGHFSPTV